MDLVSLEGRLKMNVHLKRLFLGAAFSILVFLILFGVDYIVEDITGQSHEETVRVIMLTMFVTVSFYAFGYGILEESSP